MSTLEQRLLSKRSIDPVTGCWNWTGAKGTSPDNYGVMRIGGSRGKMRPVHRIAAMLWLDFDIDDSLCVLHHCDNPPCFNPAHLFLGTRTDNNRDRARKKRGRESHQQGEENPNRRLTEDDVRRIRQMATEGRTQMDIAAAFAVKQPQVSRIVRRESWSHLT